MLSQKNRIYISTFINTLGNWLTFLAIALITKEKYGASQVALVFLVQTLPAIIFSQSLSRIIPIEKIEKYYWAIQVLLAACSLLMVASQSLLMIYTFLIITSLLKSISNPLFNSLIGKWINKDDQKHVFTRIGALQAGTLALAPAIGALIKIMFSANVLFILDALTFILSIVFLKELFLPANESNHESSIREWRSLVRVVLRLPSDTPLNIRSALVQWFLFLGVGALLNAIEFSGFEKIKMTEGQIGYAMTAWGIGNLIAFVFKNPSSSLIPTLFGYAASLTLFVFAPAPVAIIFAFLIAGVFSSYLAGSLLAAIQGSVPTGYNPLPVWAYANQMTQVINLIAYGSAGCLLNIIGYQTFGGIMVGLLILMILRSSNFSKNTIHRDLDLYR
jgi:MFS family permease